VVPVALWGTEALWPVGVLLPRPGKEVHIRFGAPYRMADQVVDGGGRHETAADVHRSTDDRHETSGDGHETQGVRQAPTGGRHAALDAASDDLMRRIADLLPETYRGRFR